MKQSELGNIVASGRATAEHWAAYWSAYAEDVERQRREKERHERELAEEQGRPKPFDDTHLPAEPVEAPQRHRSTAAGVAGIGLGSALAIVLSFQLNHSILWAIVHGILSWFYVLYRAWQGNY